MKKLSIPELEEWYQKRLQDESKDFIKEAEKSYKSVERLLRDVDSIATQLREESEKDDEEALGIATRFALKIREIVDDFEVKSDITYESTEDMQEAIQDFIQELWGAGARWIKRMDKRHKSTIKQLDIYMKELANEMKNLSKLLYEYSWVKDLERIGTRIDTLKDLTYGKAQFEEQIRQVTMKMEQARKEYEEAQHTYVDFKEKSNVSDLLNLDEDADHVAVVLKMKLNTLRKPVKKFTQQDTGVMVGPSGQKALNDYWEDPYTAIVEEPEGHPALLEGLAGVEKAVDKDTLKIKDRLARRAVEEIEAIRGGMLLDLQQQAKEIENKRREYAESDVYRRDEKLQEEVKEAKKNLEYHKNDLLRIADDIERQIEKIEVFKRRIMIEIKKAFDERIHIEIEDHGLEPLLVECRAKAKEVPS